MTSPLFDLKTYLADIRFVVDDQLQRYLGGPAPETRLYQAMYYSVMAGGKRLRPVLCIAAAEAAGGDRGQVMPVACALECIHTYSLIHDDLPAMDDDDLRRGQPTCHIRFDEATAILAGDGLLTLAFEIMATAASQTPAATQGRWIAAIGRIAAAAGATGMIEGQMRDMMFEGTLIENNALEVLHRLKTGQIIEAAVDAGAILSCASDHQQQALSSYARHIGLAFQVTDDILNVKGDPRELGKATGTDQSRGKNTYPSLLGLAGAENYAQSLVEKALKALDTFDRKADSLRAIARYVVARKR